MGWIETVFVPLVVAFIAYVSGLRALLWAAEKIDQLLPPGIRQPLMRRLTNWWEKVETTPLPNLARREAYGIVSAVDEFLRKDGHSRSLKVSLSFFVTTGAFLLGDIVFLIAGAFGITIQRIAQSFGTLPPSFSPLVMVPWVLFNATFCYLFLRTLARPSERAHRLYLYSAWYLVLGPLTAEVSVAIQQFYERLTLVAATGAVVAVYALSVRGFRRWQRPIRGLLRRTVPFLILLAVIRGLSFTALAGFRDLFWSLLLYGSNYLFDLLTISITLLVLRKLMVGSSVTNFLWIILDVGLAIFFALCVYVMVQVSMGVVYGFGISTTGLLQRIVDTTLFSLATLSLGLIFFAVTTAIPTAVYGTFMIMSYLGRLTCALTGRTSRLLFFKPRPKEMRTPVYLTLATLAVVLSLVPAYVAWLGTRSTMSPG